MMFNDPMVKFPKYPFLLPGLKFIRGNGFTIYGSPGGVFKLNGSAVGDLLQKLYPLLSSRKNTFEQLVAASGLEAGRVMRVLEILFAKGCLIDYVDYEPLSRLEKYFVKNMSKNKNYNSVEDLHQLLSEKRVCVLASGESPLAEEVRRRLTDSGITPIEQSELSGKDLVVYVTSNDWEPQLDEILPTNDVLLFCHSRQALQIGPLLGRKAVHKERYLAEKLKNPPLEAREAGYDEAFGRIILLHTLKEYFKFGERLLLKNYIEVSADLSESNVVSIRYGHYLGEDSLIGAYEDRVGFPATKYLNKTSHLAHYKASNAKLTIGDGRSFLWKKTDGANLDPKITELANYLVGYKQKDGPMPKKMCPTGGNINSNLLYIINMNPEYLEGEGLYFYSNLDGSFYMIDRLDRDRLQAAFGGEIENKGSGVLVVPASDVDMIGSKYNDFSFKVANLNLGVLLSQFATAAQVTGVRYNVVTRFDEKKLLELFGIKTTNELINYVIEVV